MVGWERPAFYIRRTHGPFGFDRRRAWVVALLSLPVSLFFTPSLSRGQDPAVVGQYSSVTTWPYVATHASVLPTGKVLWWPNYANGDNPTLWDPATNTNT